MTDPDPTSSLIAFLRGIGLVVYEQPLGGDSFLPGLRVRNGELLVDRDALTWPGDLLHEAGHLAVLPPDRRGASSDALEELDEVALAGEAEATAWAWAALVHLGLRPDLLFHDAGYHGRSARLIATFSAGVYPGCHGLVMAGLTLTGADAQVAGVPPYPHMIRWLRE